MRKSSQTSTRKKGHAPVPGWHAGFLRLLPVIRRRCRVVFGHLTRSERNEVVAEVTALAVIQYLRCLEYGVSEAVECGVLAAAVVRSVRHGGRACGQESSRDVLSPTAQRRHGFSVERLQEAHDTDRQPGRIDLRTTGPASAGQPALRPPALAAARDVRRSAVLVQERGARREAELMLAGHQLDFEVARRIQQKLLPAATLTLPGFDIGGMVRPAEATGGDYFDYVPMPNGAVGVVVGDVSGHSFGPALLIASTRAYLRAFAQTHHNLGELLGLTNQVLTLDTAGEQFVTLIFVRLDLGKKSLIYVSAGHPTGYILSADGQPRVHLASTSPPLGIEPRQHFLESAEIPLQVGDIVLLLSDGVTEGQAPDGTAFGWWRAVNIVRLYRDDPAAQIAANLYNAVRAFAQNAPQLDDITVVLIKVLPNGSGADFPEGVALARRATGARGLTPERGRRPH